MTIDAILSRADELHRHQLAESTLPDTVANLTLDEQTLQALIQKADAASRTQPRLGWAIMAVTDAAAAHSPSTRLQAQAAWHLARLANEYHHPPKAREALARAHRLFTERNEPGWLAACTWQQHALPVANMDIPQSIVALHAALREMEAAGEEIESFLPYCHLTLAYNYNMMGNLAKTIEHCQTASNEFERRDDPFSQAKCLWLKATAVRRTGDLNKINQLLSQAFIATADWPAEKARFMIIQGYAQWLQAGDYAGAAATLLEAISQFAALEIPLWKAQAQNALAQVYSISGRLDEAEKLLQEALQQAEALGAVHLKGALYLDSGWYYTFRGENEQALAYLQQAVETAEKIGNQGLHAAALMHIGEVYAHLGRFQLGLRYLEESLERFEASGNSGRLAECELRLAEAWRYLGNSALAHRYLDRAAEHARQASHPTIWSHLFKHRATIYLREEKQSLALAVLEEGLNVARQQNDPYGTALAHRTLGETLLAQGQPHEALPHLEMADAGFQTMHMSLEQALCDIAWGRYFQLTGDPAHAQARWEQAFAASLDTMPDIAWQAAAGLASLAEERGNDYEALHWYHHMREALYQMRQGIWQAELTSDFLQLPGPALDKAVELAVRKGTIQDVLVFVEETKARLNNRHILTGQSSLPAHLQAMLGQLRWLSGQLRATPGQPRFWSSAQEERELKQQLRELRQQYQGEWGQWQLHNPRELAEATETAFDQIQFRRTATEQLGSNWVVLDYYLTDNQLQGAVLSPQDSYTWTKKLTPRVHRALDDLIRYGLEAPADNHNSPLGILGQFLIPETVLQRLTPETNLILVPHRRLHDVPWSALRVGSSPLVARCVPVVTQSLSGLISLWSRPRYHTSPLATGLLVAVSDFLNERLSRLEVQAECQQVLSHLGTGTHLWDSEATWENFLALGTDEGLQRFSFWHVASHAYHEAKTGRLSWISFYDQDILLDELWECAPLPSLVVLSACSGNKGKLYEGDEHVGLATTCLAAGAHTVVGSLWPVHDKEAPALMGNFYDALAQGQSVAMALASAQRQAWHEGKPWQVWGGFTCTGVPG